MYRLTQQVLQCALGLLFATFSVSTPTTGACSVPTPTVMSAQSTLVLALAVGFPRPVAKRMVVVAKRESNLQPKVVNRNRLTHDESYGLWQINMWGALGPERMRKFRLRKRTDLLDPVVNARAAYKLWREAGEDPWKTAQ